MSSLPDRFWAKVQVRDDGCWAWTATIDRYGYGQFGQGGQMRNAHRVAFEGLRGGVPDGFQLDHLCRNRACVNPAHLEAVTPRENSLRGVSPWAKNARKVRCNRGHEFHVRYVSGKARRDCRTCNADDARAYRARQCALTDGSA